MARLLIIEDDPGYRGLLRLILRSGGHDSIEAGTGATGIRKARSSAPDAVLVDWCLPKGDGLAVLRALRADPRTAATPVVMMSAVNLTVEHEALALGRGADWFFAKMELDGRARTVQPFLRHLEALIINKRNNRIPAPAADPKQYSFHGLRYRPATNTLLVGRKTSLLAAKEAGLIEVFLRRPGIIHSPQGLWDAVWRDESYSGDWHHVVERWISSLRSKLGPEWGPRLRCRKRQGFILELPPRRR